MTKQKIIVVLGPTSSGKSELAVKLARKFSGEVISADSRQVYRGLDIGTGKITEEEMGGVPHHLLDVADPKKEFSVVRFKRLAEKAIREILERGKLPIVVGGTGFYIEAIVDNITPPRVPPNEELRKKLSLETTDSLLATLKKLDPDRAGTVEKENPRRLIRAIEIARYLGKVPEKKAPDPKYDSLQIGLKIDTSELEGRIEKRVRDRLENRWIAEVWGFIKSGVGWNRMQEFGLGYKCIADYLEKKVSESKLEDCIINAEKNYAKRQVRWFKCDKRIRWFAPDKVWKIEKEVLKFLAS